MMFLFDLLLGSWRPPTPARSTKHRLLGGNGKGKSVPIFARAKILAVLTDDWKTNKDIAQETGLQLNTVQQKTARLFLSGKVDKTTKKTAGDIKPVCLYRKKQ